MRLRRRSCPRSGGFTLVEVLIVIAIIGVMAALAIAGYRRYVHAAQGSEARAVIGMIRSGEEAYRAETLQYLGCQTTFANGSYWPNTSPDDTRWAWERSSDTAYKTCWAYLNVHPGAPVRYGYAVVAGNNGAVPPNPDNDFVHPPAMTGAPQTNPWYVVGARNVHMGKPPSLAVAASWDNNVYTEGDAD
jgi:type IV pilus assembly protein PilA